MASSDDRAVRAQIVQAMRALAPSSHSDVHRFGMDIMEALPAAESAGFVDVLENWIIPDTDLFAATPHKIIAKLAAAGQVEAAVRVTRAVFQLFERDGKLAAHLDTTMYEHYLEAAVRALSAAQPLKALPGICILLLEASRADTRLSQLDEADYSYYTVGSFDPEPTHGHDFLGSLVVAVVRLGAAAIRANPADVTAVLEQLQPYRAKIFARMRLHLLAMAPAAAPDLAATDLTDASLIDATWCREEYAALAKAWFPLLSQAQQTSILDYIESVPESFLETWRARFEQYEKRKPEASDERQYRETTVREIVWRWRAALPAEYQATVEKTTAEFGDPEAWRERHFRQAESPLGRATRPDQPAEGTVGFLLEWQPDPMLQSHTAGALANELREAAVARPESGWRSGDHQLPLVAREYSVP
jgi:hypothetical protein